MGKNFDDFINSMPLLFSVGEEGELEGSINKEVKRIEIRRKSKKKEDCQLEDEGGKSMMMDNLSELVNIEEITRIECCCFWTN